MSESSPIKFGPVMDAHIETIHKLKDVSPKIEQIASQISSILNSGGKIVLFGNGGSAADAQHIAAEFVVRYKEERRSFPALALSTDTSILTAIGNDYGFDQLFSRQVESLVKDQDLVIGISTSGNSVNVANGLTQAAAIGAATVGLTGMRPGIVGDAADVTVNVPDSVTARVQECHILIGHFWCDYFDSNFASQRVLCESSKEDTGIVSEDALEVKIKEAKARGERVIMTNGCFDILHPGHVDYLRKAKLLGERLVVALNDDASIKRLKGDSRPVNPLSTRSQMIAALASVDWVVPFSEDTPERLYQRMLPDVLVKGGDYKTEDVAGGPAVIAAGGQVKIIEFLEGYSTTSLIENIKNLTE